MLFAHTMNEIHATRALKGRRDPRSPFHNVSSNGTCYVVRSIESMRLTGRLGALECDSQSSHSDRPPPDSPLTTGWNWIQRCTRLCLIMVPSVSRNQLSIQIFSRITQSRIFLCIHTLTKVYSYYMFHRTKNLGKLAYSSITLKHFFRLQLIEVGRDVWNIENKGSWYI